MRSFSPPFQKIAEPGSTLHYRYKGDAGALRQAVFIGFIAAVCRMADLPDFIWGSIALISGILSVGALGNALIVWELHIDSAAKSYQVIRGFHPCRRRIAGSLEDFAFILADAGFDRMHVFLVPKGSRRGYDLHRHLDREGAIHMGQNLAKELGLPFQEQKYEVQKIPEVGLDAVPEHIPILSKAIPGGIELELTPHGRLWHEWLRLTDKGIESGLDFAAPWGRRYPTSRSIAWKDINQIIHGINTHGETGSDGTRTTHWRFKRNGREDLRAQWRDRCAELKIPYTQPPFWGWLWYFGEGEYREYNKCVSLYHNKGVSISIGSGFKLGMAGLEWLYAGIVTFGRKHNARFTTES